VKKMSFQRLSERIEGESWPPKPGWKVVPQSRTGSRETPVAKFVVCSWHEQLPDAVGMRPQRATTSIKQKIDREGMYVILLVTMKPTCVRNLKILVSVMPEV